MDRSKIVTVDSGEPGKIVTIMAGVHGNEPCGVQALDELSGTLKVVRGKVHLTYGNPRAIEGNVRQTDMNLNRAFRPNSQLLPGEEETYERGRALEIMPFLAESDALLDLHSSSSEESTPFVICEPHSFWIAARLPFPIRSWGWDAIHPGGTDYFVNRSGGFGICVECGYHLDPEAPRRARDAIIAFLSLFDLSESPDQPGRYSQREIYAHGIYHTKTDFTPAKKFADFEPVAAGQVVGVDGSLEVRVKRGGIIIFPRASDKPNQEAFALGKETNISTSLRSAVLFD